MKPSIGVKRAAGMKCLWYKVENKIFKAWIGFQPFPWAQSRKFWHHIFWRMRHTGLTGKRKVTQIRFVFFVMAWEDLKA